MRPNFQNLAIAAALGGVVAVAIAAAIIPGRADPAAAAIAIDNFTFNPHSITIKAGTTVTWTNKDDIPHALAATDRSFKSKTLDTDDRYAFTFTAPGTYPYFCSLHPRMTGTIVVEAAN